MSADRVTASRPAEARDSSDARPASPARPFRADGSGKAPDERDGADAPVLVPLALPMHLQAEPLGSGRALASRALDSVARVVHVTATDHRRIGACIDVSVGLGNGERLRVLVRLEGRDVDVSLVASPALASALAVGGRALAARLAARGVRVRSCRVVPATGRGGRR
jgi:hypothetical protein